MLKNEAFLQLQFPAFNDNKLYTDKLDFADAIKRKTSTIPKTCEVQFPKPNSDLVVTTQITWLGSTKLFMAEYMATYMFCEELFDLNLGKN